ncbi:MAG: EamA family transporter, partial [Comamonas sp.]
MSAVNSPFSGRDLFAALSVVVIWGLNFVAMKWALAEFTPFQLGIWRDVFAALRLVFIVRRPAVPWRWVVAYGLCQGVGQFGVLFIALQVGMTAALASVLMQTQLFFTALLGVLLLTFVVIQFVPGGPVEQYLAEAKAGVGGATGGGGGMNYRGAQGVDPQRLEQIKALYGF